MLDSKKKVAEWDRSETFPESVYQGLSELGALGLTFPEEYGGQLADEFTICVTVEELAIVAAFSCTPICRRLPFAPRRCIASAPRPSAARSCQRWRLVDADSLWASPSQMRDRISSA